jgi:IS30 family transposase
MSYDYKHLTLDQRLEIQVGLKEGITLKALSEKLNKSPRTLSQEIKIHLERKENQRAKFSQNEKKSCSQHLRYPYVCDRCPFKIYCTSDFYSYDAKKAEASYRSTLRETRQGIHITKDEFEQLDDLLKQGIYKGQSPIHIKESHPEITVSERTIYRYLDQGILSTEVYKLRNKVRMRKRKSKSSEPLDKGIYAGRTFMDYLGFIHKHPGMYTTEMDTVIGLKSDRKMILTFIIIELHLFYACIVYKGVGGVIRGIHYIEDMIGLNGFKRLFPVLLTDRGVEFRTPEDIEKNILGETRTHVFYCDPLASYQKGAIESIHRLLRYVFPKGKTLDHLTQAKLSKVISHINSYKLRSNQFRTAYELTKEVFGKEVLDQLKIEAIDPDSIHLTPDLVK